MQILYAPTRAVETTIDTPVRYSPHRFTVDEYYRMAETGILNEHDRVELIDGQILVMEPISSEHGGHTKRINRLLTSLLGDRAIIGVQDPIQIDEFNHPQPDITVCRPRDDFYTNSHPEADDILLVVEIAWTSAMRDRGLKVPLYGRAGITEFWLVDIPNAALEVYTGPSDDGYDKAVRLRRGASVRPVAFPDVEIRIDDVVGFS